MDFETATALAAALDQLESRDDLSVAIVTGAGGTFCSGMDPEGLPGRQAAEAFAGPRLRRPGLEAPPRKVLIAAVEGYALAGGFEMALACDLIVASKAAKSWPARSQAWAWVAAAGGPMRPRRAGSRTTSPWSTRRPAHMLGAEQAACTRPGEPPDRAGPGTRSRTRPGRGSRCQWPDGRSRQQADRQRIRRLVGRRNVRAPAPGSPPRCSLPADARGGAAASAEKRKPVWDRRASGIRQCKRRPPRPVFHLRAGRIAIRRLAASLRGIDERFALIETQGPHMGRPDR
ncbi:enoyl-CoA hydratase-related protein [Cupriavidus basilensis]